MLTSYVLIGKAFIRFGGISVSFIKFILCFEVYMSQEEQPQCEHFFFYKFKICGASSDIMVHHKLLLLGFHSLLYSRL